MSISRTTSASSISFAFDDGDESDGQTEIIAYGVASTVSLVRDDQVVIKTSTTNKKFAKEPHDIRRECRILNSLEHPNIISLLAFHDDEASHTLQLHMSYVPSDLESLLTLSSFTPYDTRHFEMVTKSIMYQVLLGVTYLHSPPHRIAHRDLKPSNVLLTQSGCVKLIDFGVSYDPNPDPQDIWHEDNSRMYFEVSTGPYRAPELLFGARTYDPYAIDLWSLGCLFADFYTPLVAEEEDDGYPEYSPEDPALTRKTLFDGSRGEIGLIWSIFKTMGTPTAQTWPDFGALPDAKRLEFNVVPPRPLQDLLPNASPDGAELALIRALLKYPPSARLSAKDALQHAVFSAKLLLPLELAVDGRSFLHRNDANQTLADILDELLDR